jgi:hypothetical protein
MIWLSSLAGSLVLAASPADADTSGPALRFYEYLDAPVELSIDQAQPAKVDAKTLNTIPLAPGDHVVAARLENDALVRAVFRLRQSELVVSHGHTWWCVLLLSRAGSPVLVELSPDRCKAVADSGPD